MNVTLTNVHFIPEAICNLFSLTEAMSKDWKLSGDKNGMCIRKGKMEILFGQKIKSPKGTIFGVEIHPSAEFANLAKTTSTMTYKEAHGILGHAGKDTVKITAEAHGWKLLNSNVDNDGACNGCQVSKARRINMPKTSPALQLEKGL